ncbi:MAG: hypothetical protein ACE5EY_14340, partial [Anaerolineae bacterium]
MTARMRRIARMGTDFLWLKSAIFLGIVFLTGCKSVKEAAETAVALPPTITPANTSEPYPAPPTAIPERGYPNGIRPSPLPVSPTPVAECVIGSDLKVSLTEPFDPFTALLVLYGDGCIDNENRSVILNDERGYRWIISPLIAVPYEEDGRAQMLFLAEKTRSDWVGLCHPCGAVVAGFLLARENDQWRVTAQRDLFTEGLGSWGSAPPATPIQLGPTVTGALFRPAYTNTGYTSESIVIVAPWHNEPAVVADIPDAGSQEVVMNSWGYTAVIETIPGAHPGFEDLQVTVS